ncbi:MAG: hypothetical protein KC422_18925 [Trueperaceae bacterium]|nr:hypothetical protein [Trueperaceae bacterium]
MFRGAGGTEGGMVQFLVGLALMVGGGYLFLDSIQVRTGFGMGYRLYGFGGFQITSGMLLIPFMIGVSLIFYSRKNYLGWVLAGAALVALVFGVIRSVNFVFVGMSAFDLLLILTLFAGGLGLFLNSLRKLK